MSGRFMSVKRIIIPTITALMIASQLVGCAGATESELLSMINNQQAIEIEVSTPEDSVEASSLKYNWVELASLNTHSDFRQEVDDALMITNLGSGGKNGTMYVDLDGMHTDNSTMWYAFANKKFRNQLNDTDTMKIVKDAVKSAYSDITEDYVAEVAWINAYFNIFTDSESGTFDSNDVLTRAEFMGGLYRAENPVTSLVTEQEFVSAVDEEGKNENTKFASQNYKNSYLGLDDKSLNNMTFNGAMTRGEAIYMLVKTYYADDFEQATTKDSCFSDVKAGGNIALKQGFITQEKNKETKETITTYKDYWKSYELQYAIQNADKGCPDDIYKALVVAKNKGLIKSDTCRWDEGITKGEAISFIKTIFLNKQTVTDVDRGEASATISEHVVDTTMTTIDGNAGSGIQQNISLSSCTYDDTSKEYKISEEVKGELGLRYPGVMSKIDESIEQAFYDYLFNKDIENTTWDIINIKMKALEDGDPAASLANMGYIESKPAETKPAETKPAETKPAETKPAETKPAETQAPVQNTPPEDNSGYLSDEEAEAFIKSQGFGKIDDPGEYDDTDYGDVGIH